MSLCKDIFKEFLKALLAGDAKKIADYMGEDTCLHMNMVREASALKLADALKVPDDFQVRVSTVTNCMEIENENDTILFATVHHLLALDREQQIYPFLFGGKYRFVLDKTKKKIKDVWFDLEYLSGNTYLVRKQWMPLVQTKRIIPDEELQTEMGKDTPEESLYRFFWALDTCNEELLRAVSAENLQIVRAGVDGDSYECGGIEHAEAFMKRDKDYYSQNQYSIHVNSKEYANENEVVIHAFHLYPANTGNKHLGSQNKYTQFYNEIITARLEKGELWKVQSVEFRRKENPTPYGYEILEL